MKFLKKNQVVIYVIALMLVVAAYLNYIPTGSMESLQATTSPEEVEGLAKANVGDAQLVNSDAIQELNTSANEAVSENIETGNDSQQSEEVANVQSEYQNGQSEQNTQNVQNYFTTSKLERETMYSQMLETYEKVLDSSNALETQKQSATQEITKINETKNKIMICENLIRTKGFENNVIFVNGDSVSIIIGKNGGEELKTEEVAQIQNIVAREMNTKIENIHIASK